MNSGTAASISKEIIGLYEKHGGSAYAGEKISQLEHMMQAAELAEQQGYDEEVILAAFLHDIGHICVSAQGVNEMDGFGIIDHEEVGADFLKEKGFSKKLVRLVESHVEAKRYLTFKDPEYYAQLSDASKATLEFQGGRMEADEAAAFEQYPLFKLIITLRKWDEEAKIENRVLPELAHYQDMITRHLEKNQTVK